MDDITNIRSAIIAIDIDIHDVLTAGYQTAAQVQSAATAAMALNVWNSICVRREGGTIVVYLNGVQVGTGASILNVYFNSYVQVPVIGGDTDGRTLIGNIGNFRINRQDPKVSTDPIELTM